METNGSPFVGLDETTLRELAPRVAPDTVVVIATARDRRAPYSAHYEISSYLLALYDDWSVMVTPCEICASIVTGWTRPITDRPAGGSHTG